MQVYLGVFRGSLFENQVGVSVIIAYLYVFVIIVTVFSKLQKFSFKGSFEFIFVSILGVLKHFKISILHI